MIFSDFYKGPRSPLAKFRQPSSQVPSQLPNTTAPDWISDEHAELWSKDKIKQKEAVRRYLATKVKNDWQFEWPPSEYAKQPSRHVRTVSSDPAGGHQQHVALGEDGYEVNGSLESDDEDPEDAVSVYSIVSEDAVNFQPLVEWASDLSDDEEPLPSPYRFDSPEAVGPAVQASLLEKQARRRRAAREEMTWNDGLACFEARRQAWTHARTVRIRNKQTSPPPMSPRSPRRLFFRRSISESPPNSTTNGLVHIREIGSSTTSDTSSIAKDDKHLTKQGSADSREVPDHLLPVETLLPLAHPILPPSNSLRASITPSVYLNLYDKIILNNLQPSCPINLSDMLSACVAGWKRDGEWPPRSSAPDPSLAAMRRKKVKKASTGTSEPSSTAARRLSFGLLGRDKEDESRTGKGIRRSLQKALGLGSLPGSPDQ